MFCSLGLWEIEFPHAFWIIFVALKLTQSACGGELIPTVYSLMIVSSTFLAAEGDRLLTNNPGGLPSCLVRTRNQLPALVPMKGTRTPLCLDKLFLFYLKRFLPSLSRSPQLFTQISCSLLWASVALDSCPDGMWLCACFSPRLDWSCWK